MRDLLGAGVEELCAEARAIRAAAHGRRVTYSPKVFIPLTQLCRDVCGYCTFARPPRRGEPAYLSIDRVLEIARAGAAAGCREALFTLGDKPELRFRSAREELAGMGFATTLEYLEHAARTVLADRRSPACCAIRSTRPEPGFSRPQATPERCRGPG